MQVSRTEAWRASRQQPRPAATMRRWPEWRQARGGGLPRDRRVPCALLCRYSGSASTSLPTRPAAARMGCRCPSEYGRKSEYLPNNVRAGAFQSRHHGFVCSRDVGRVAPDRGQPGSHENVAPLGEMLDGRDMRVPLSVMFATSGETRSAPAVGGAHVPQTRTALGG